MRVFVGGLFALFASNAVFATMSLPFDQVAADQQACVAGAVKVTGINTEEVDKNIFSIYQIELVSGDWFFGGDLVGGPRTSFRIAGGKLGARQTRIVGAPTFEIGSEFVAYLWNKGCVAGSAFTLYSWNGIQKIEKDARGDYVLHRAKPSRNVGRNSRNAFSNTEGPTDLRNFGESVRRNRGSEPR